MMSINPTVEVCREYLDQKCKRDERYCKFAHPLQKHEILNGRVVCCVDSLKNRCHRDNPPCKFYHPPKHLRDRLLSEMKYLNQGRDSEPSDEEESADLQSAVINTLLPQLNMLTDKIIKYGKTEGYDNLDPNVTDTLKSCQAFLDVLSQSDADEGQQRNDLIEVCREFLRGDCNRGDGRCRFAHPGPKVHINSDQTVTVCMKHMRGACLLDGCRYFHAPNHLKKFVNGDFLQGKRKRRLSSERDEEGPSSKLPFDCIQFGRTPPREEMEGSADFGQKDVDDTCGQSPPTEFIYKDQDANAEGSVSSSYCE